MWNLFRVLTGIYNMYVVSEEGLIDVEHSTEHCASVLNVFLVKF